MGLPEAAVKESEVRTRNLASGPYLSAKQGAGPIRQRDKARRERLTGPTRSGEDLGLRLLQLELCWAAKLRVKPGHIDLGSRKGRKEWGCWAEIREGGFFFFSILFSKPNSIMIQMQIKIEFQIYFSI